MCSTQAKGVLFRLGLALVAGTALLIALYAGLSSFAYAESAPAPLQTPAPADYGDAPDNMTFTYPSLYTTTNSRIPGRRGPFHLDVSQEWFGPFPRTTTTEADALVVDLDLDDGNPFMFVVLTSLPAPAVFQIDVSIDPNADNSTRYLNVLVDHDNDNQWATSYVLGTWDEWIMQNVPINVPAGETRRIQTPVFAFSPDVLLFPVWVRVSLTTEPIDGAMFGALGWDGSGPGTGFTRGETEDHHITLGTTTPFTGGHGGGSGGGGLPITKTVICEPAPRVIWLPEGGAVRNFVVDCRYWGTDPLLPPGVTVSVGPCVGNGLNIFPPANNPIPDAGPGCIGLPPTCTLRVRQTWGVQWFPFGPPDSRRATCPITYEYDPPGIIVIGHAEVEVIEPPPSAPEVYVPTDTLPLQTVETHVLQFPITARYPLTPPAPGLTTIRPVELPEGATFQILEEGEGWAQGVFSWTTGLCDAGYHTAIFEGEQISGTQSFVTPYEVDLLVSQLNRPPDELIYEPPETTTLHIGQVITIPLMATDPDVEACLEPEDRLFLDAVVHSTQTTPPTVVDNGDGTGHVVWQPGVIDLGPHTFIFTATDLYGASIAATLDVEVVGGCRIFLPMVLRQS
jgi:hypothetical protein